MPSYELTERDDPRVQALVQQMYGQRDQVGKISSFAGYMNMQYLLGELRKLGWSAQLKADGNTIKLIPLPLPYEGE